MKFYSTRREAPIATFREALFRGQAGDGGLFMPESFPHFAEDELADLRERSYPELAVAIASKVLAPEIDKASLERIVQRAYTFSPVLKELNQKTYCLELYHGPTLSFKDYGAQFMAHAMCHFIAAESRTLTILVATSGDTGSAVAHAYHNVEGIRVVLLYPSGKVSPLQEKQLTTLGDNIESLEVEGTFDDCQALVKRAFVDEDLKEKLSLSSANSINIGRLIPQSFYYFWSVANVLAHHHKEIIVCVPSGNFGNMTAALFAREMGLPVKKYVAAVNSNAVVPEYLETGEYRPRPSTQTLSNAMDVGAPSNWERVRTLFNDDHRMIQEYLWSTSVDDVETTAAMKGTYEQFGYIIDPHTAVGVEAAGRFRRLEPWAADLPCIVVSTAHPGKFQQLVRKTLNVEIDLPQQLKTALAKDKQAVLMRNDYEIFKEFLWESR